MPRNRERSCSRLLSLDKAEVSLASSYYLRMIASEARRARRASLVSQGKGTPVQCIGVSTSDILKNMHFRHIVHRCHFCLFSPKYQTYIIKKCDPTRPDPTRPDPTRPGPTVDRSKNLTQYASTQSILCVNFSENLIKKFLNGSLFTKK